MPTDFCSALLKDDRLALRDVVDAQLASQPTAESLAARIERLRQWIARQPCVAAAELIPVLLDTEPPVQQIRVVLTGAHEPGRDRSIDIVLDPLRPRFNYR